MSVPGYDLDVELVELAPCPHRTAPPPVPLREMPYRADAWTPRELTTLTTLFTADESIEAIAAATGRPRSGVATKIQELGLRRNSMRPWNELEDRVLLDRYGQDPTATLAGKLGRSCAAVYARAATLGLTEGNAPPYDAWEDAQIREGYARGVPVQQIAVLIGRPMSGVTSRAYAIGVSHARHPPDWSQAESARALDLAEQGHRYLAIIEMLVEEGFPRRSKRGFGLKVRMFGYGRGWGRRWTLEEDGLLTQAYANGDSLTPLRTRLGRSDCSIRWRVEALGLRGTHKRPNGFRLGPNWTEKDIEMLRENFGKIPSPELARMLGRTKAAMFCRANLLGLVHGYIRPFSEDEGSALDIAFRNGISIADLAVALDRKPMSVSKYATNHGYRFGRRPRRIAPLSLSEILALDQAGPHQAGKGNAMTTQGKVRRHNRPRRGRRRIPTAQ